MTLEEKGKQIIQDIKEETGISPVRIFKNMAQKDYVAIHGPEHHVLDGAGLLVACKNAGMAFDLDEGLNKLLNEGLRMPGAMCGLWGVCGAVTSIGAALAILDETGPCPMTAAGVSIWLLPPTQSGNWARSTVRDAVSVTRCSSSSTRSNM